MAPENDWRWEFTEQAERQLSKLDSEFQKRIIAKLNEVVHNEWREPPDVLEPLRGSPYQKLRVGDYRLGCVVDANDKLLTVVSVRPRSSAYKGDD